MLNMLSTLGMASSALAWAQNAEVGDLILENKEASPSSVEWLAAPNLIKENQSDTAILNSEDALPSGTLFYTINHPSYSGYSFEIQIINGRDCLINGKNEITLNGNNAGPAKYKVHTEQSIAQGELTCDVHVTFMNDQVVIPKLVFEEVATQNFNNTIIDVKPFELYIGNERKMHLAVLTTNKIHIYQVNDEGKLTWLHDIVESEYTLPSGVDFFSGNDGNSNQYLVVSYAGQSKQQSAVAIYIWGVNNKEEFGRIDTIATSAATDVQITQDREDNNVMLITNGGDAIRGFNNRNNIYRYTAGEFVVDESLSFNAANSQGGIIFQGKDKLYYGSFDRHNHITKEGYNNIFKLHAQDSSLIKKNVCGVTDVEYFSVNDEDHILLANSCIPDDSTLFTSQHYNLNSTDQADTISFSSVPPSNWKVIKTEDNLPYFFAGFTGSTAPSAEQSLVYGWCNKDGDDAVREWCNASGENSYIRAYNVPIPNPTGSMNFQTFKWESMQIGEQLFAIRMGKDTSNGQNSLQILTVDTL